MTSAGRDLACPTCHLAHTAWYARAAHRAKPEILFSSHGSSQRLFPSVRCPLGNRDRPGSAPASCKPRMVSRHEPSFQAVTRDALTVVRRQAYQSDSRKHCG